MTTVIFACVHNAGRSQMAAAFFNHMTSAVHAHAISAGTSPGPRVHPEVIEVMREKGVDLSTAEPRLLSSELGNGADWLITMGCGEGCPVLPRVRREDWPLDDPKGKPLEDVRRIRDEIELRVSSFLVAQGWASPRSA